MINRGPDVVLKSLIRGLKQADIKFNINPSASKLAKTVHVISNPKALEWALKKKKDGLILKLIAGPNISILPSENTRILCNPLIDRILVPSEWSKEAHIQSEPSIIDKIRIWPAGVSIPKEFNDFSTNSVNINGVNNTSSQSRQNEQRESKILIFKKQVPDSLSQGVIQELEKLGIAFDIIEYGSFNQSTYFNFLKQCRAMIYLQEVESQGIALQEAWSFNVATYVWNKGVFTYPDTNITVSGKVSAPYLTEEAGMFFSDLNEFKANISVFLARLNSVEFQPRKYCTEHLSDQVSVNIYMNILNEIKHE